MTPTGPVAPEDEGEFYRQLAELAGLDPPLNEDDERAYGQHLDPVTPPWEGDE